MNESTAGTTTLLFTDMEGSTNILQRLGDHYAAVLADHHRLLRDAFTTHGGAEIDSAGDGLYYRFTSARAALAAAVEGQRALLGHDWPEGATVRVRMGIHTGEPLDAEVGLVGIDVHRTARICDAGHGGQILVSRTTRDLAGRELPAGVSLVDLGVHKLKDLVEPQQLYQVETDDLPRNFPPLRLLGGRPTNLPRRLTPFVGRDRELAELQALVASSPLVTLTGPGGVGKTRMALQVALAVINEFPDGVWLVELGKVSDETLVAHSIATALSVAEQPGRDLQDTLVEYLRNRRLCLVLDNCEHLLGPVAETAYAILRGTDTRVLATSREALGVEGERAFPVASLALPGRHATVGADDAARFDAIRLFVDRATAAQPAFALSDGNVGTVVQLCRRLDGMPLALELAAARVRALPIDEIAARLDDRFRLLTGGSRAAVPRHQTLRATIDWSHDLLSEDERVVFRRLAVFAGGFSLPAAEDVAAGDSVAGEDVLDILTRLVDKSLVNTDTDSGEARFTMLETVRQYAGEKLMTEPELESVFSRHRDWYVALVERAKAAFFGGPPPVKWLATFDREHDNLRTALEWSGATAGGAAAGLRLAAGLWRYWEIRGFVIEGRQWLERMLRATDGEVSLLRANALTGAGMLAHIQGDFPAAVSFQEQSLALHRQAGNQASIGAALHNLANEMVEVGDHERARQLYDEGLAIARSMGDVHGAAAGLLDTADAVARQSYPEAEQLYDEAIGTFEQFGDRWGVALALDKKALAAARSEQFSVANELHRRSLAISRDMGDERGVGRTLSHIADVALLDGDTAAAADLRRQSLRIRMAVQDLPGVARELEKLAALPETVSPMDAARFLGAARALREAIHTPLPVRMREEEDRLIARLSAEIGEGTLEAALRDGRGQDIDDIVTLALGGDAGAPGQGSPEGEAPGDPAPTIPPAPR